MDMNALRTAPPWSIGARTARPNHTPRQSLGWSLENRFPPSDTGLVRVSFAALALLLVLPACGARTSDPVGAPPAERSPSQVRDRLDTVVVPFYEVGGLPSGLRVTPDSGWVDNRLEAEASFDRSDSASSLGRAGRVTGYVLTYYDPAETALRSGNGLHAIQTYVELFSSVNAASRSLRRHVAFARGLENTSPRNDVHFGAVKPFAVQAADEAYGLRETVTYGSDRVFRTMVGFRRGRLVGTTMAVRVDPGGGRDIAERLVGILDTRIQIALHGGSNGEPVSIPKTAAPATGARQPADRPKPPPGVPDLAAIALGPDDLPPGIPCNPGEYTKPTPPRVTFRRSFCPGGAIIGQTPLASLTSEVNLFESEQAAKASLVISARAAEGADARETFAANYSATHSLVATNVRSRRLELGGGAVGILFSFDTEAGPLVDLYSLAQAGRGVTTLDAIAPAGDFHREDLARLLQIVQRRLARLD
jgi:hypothetical protein